MHFVAVSYFDSIIGPSLLVVEPAGKSIEYLDRIPDLMNLYENEFFMHGIGDVTSANLIFNVESGRERGGIIKMQLSIVVSDTGKSINQDAARDQLYALARAIEAVDGIDEGLTVGRSTGRDRVIGLIESRVRLAHGTLPGTIFVVRPTRVKILVIGARASGKTSFLRQCSTDVTSQYERATAPGSSIALESKTRMAIERFLYGRFEVIAYDAPANPSTKTLLDPYLKDLDGVVMVLDGGRLHESDTMDSIELLYNLLERKEMGRVPLLVLTNKMDVSKPPIEDVAKLITRPTMRDNPVRAFYTSSATGEGTREALSWLLEKVAKRISPPGIELGFVFARLTKKAGLELIATFPIGIFVDPERIANRAFAAWQHVERVRNKGFDKASYILPFPQLGARVSINLNHGLALEGEEDSVPYLLAIIFKESIPDNIIEQNMPTINRLFFSMMTNSYKRPIVENNLFLLHSALMASMSKVIAASIDSRSATDAMFRQIFKSSLDAMLLLEANSRIIVDANDSAARLVGLSKEDLTGNHVTQIFPEMNIDVERRILDLMSGKDASRRFMTILTFAGNRLNIELEARRSRASGSVSLIHVIIRDTSIGLRLGLLERQHEELFRIINRSPVIAISWRLDPAVPGQKPVEFISENVRNLGYQPDDFYTGKIKFDDLIHPGDKDRVTSTVARMMAVEDCEMIDLEYRIVKRSGEVVPVKEIIELQKDLHGKTFYQQSLLLDLTSHGDQACAT